VRFWIRERFLGARDCGSLVFPCRVLPPGQSVAREQLPPLDSGASLLRLLRRHAGLHAALVPTRRTAKASRLLSWDSQRPPLRRPHRVRPLPANRGSRLPPLERIPSLSFLPTSTVSSAHGIAGLLHPAADHGVRLVSSRPPTDADDRPSTQAFHPSERSPLRQRLSSSLGTEVPSHRGSYPLAV